MSWCPKEGSVTSAKARQETSVEASLIAPDPKCYSYLGAPRAHDPAFSASPGLDGFVLHLSPPRSHYIIIPTPISARL